MALSETKDFSLRRGDNSPPVVWKISVRNEDGEISLLDQNDSTFVLTIRGPGVAISKSSADGGLVLDGGAGTVSWFYSEAESRRFPRGVPVAYELERRVAGVGGESGVYVDGTITATGGLTP